MISKTSPDRSKIIIEHEDHIKYWTGHFGVSKDELTRAIERVGNSAAAVRKQLSAPRPTAIALTVVCRAARGDAMAKKDKRSKKAKKLAREAKKEAKKEKKKSNIEVETTFPIFFVELSREWLQA